MTSTNWDIEALQRFPDLAERRFHNADTAGMLWVDLSLEFERAYESPKNEDLIARIYAFADWCLAQDDAGPEHLPTIVCTHFFEHIPTWPSAREDMPRWFTRDDVIGMRPIFSYLTGDEGYAEILKIYDSKSTNV